MSVCILILKGLNWLKELIVWSWTYLWAAWFVLVWEGDGWMDGAFFKKYIWKHRNWDN